MSTPPKLDDTLASRIGEEIKADFKALLKEHRVPASPVVRDLIAAFMAYAKKRGRLPKPPYELK